MNPKYNSPCKDCPDRCADPNCHNDNCEKWVDFKKRCDEYNELVRERKSKTNRLNDIAVQGHLNMKSRRKTYGGTKK